MFNLLIRRSWSLLILRRQNLSIMRQWIFPLSPKISSTWNPKVFGREGAHLLADNEDTADTVESPLEEKSEYEKHNRPPSSRSWRLNLVVLWWLPVIMIAAANFSLLVLVWMGRVGVIRVDGKSLPPHSKKLSPTKTCYCLTYRWSIK